jgi:hypothetical protein
MHHEENCFIANSSTCRWRNEFEVEIKPQDRFLKIEEPFHL